MTVVRQFSDLKVSTSRSCPLGPWALLREASFGPRACSDPRDQAQRSQAARVAGPGHPARSSEMWDQRVRQLCAGQLRGNCREGAKRASPRKVPGSTFQTTEQEGAPMRQAGPARPSGRPAQALRPAAWSWGPWLKVWGAGPHGLREQRGTGAQCIWKWYRLGGLPWRRQKGPSRNGAPPDCPTSPADSPPPPPRLPDGNSILRSLTGSILELPAPWGSGRPGGPPREPL